MEAECPHEDSRGRSKSRKVCEYFQDSLNEIRPCIQVGVDRDKAITTRAQHGSKGEYKYYRGLDMDPVQDNSIDFQIDIAAKDPH